MVERFATTRGNGQGFARFISTKVLASEEAVEVLATTRWQSREAFGHWIKSQEFEKAHGRGGGELLRGRPEMELYEVAVEREPEQHHDHAQ
ncbi:MAG: antibiotic biosynthesis monooxygenase [Actinomycetota bacterium]|nr:antibiotic biosynthesis monooxygenase [Actinomycetota bacterium]